MDWKTFIAQIINSIAWPLVVVFIVYQLKDRLAELLPRLKKLKHKDTELEFAEKLNELGLNDIAEIIRYHHEKVDCKACGELQILCLADSLN